MIKSVSISYWHLHFVGLKLYTCCRIRRQWAVLTASKNQVGVRNESCGTGELYPSDAYEGEKELTAEVH